MLSAECWQKGAKKDPYDPPAASRLHSAIGHPLLRRWNCSIPANAADLNPADLVLPLFVLQSGGSAEEPVVAMPGVSRMSPYRTIQFLEPLVTSKGLRAVLLFPVVNAPADKTADKADSPDKFLEFCMDRDENPVLQLLPLLRRTFPDLLVICDVCLCTFSPDGHCAVYRQPHADQNGLSGSAAEMDNAATLELLAGLAIAYARAGADVVAPSDMMDGRVGRIKQELHRHGLDRVALLSYSAKFASCLYGPFREAAGSAPSFGDRSTYQLPCGSRGLALRAASRDIREGADIIMVKPGMPYLDIVRDLASAHSEVPLAVYHVSGEYSGLVAAARSGATGELMTAIVEQMTCIKRAGASIIITYFTPLLLEWLANKGKGKEMADKLVAK